MLYREIIAVCSQIHTKHKYTVWAERRMYSGPRSKIHYVSVIQTNQPMLYSEIIAVCSQIHTKHKYTEIGRATIRERVSGKVSISVVDEPLKKKYTGK
jgi:hypothetical protein